MNPFTITRTRYVVTSTCDRCGEQGTRTTETALLRWQRAHTEEHRLAEGRRMAASPVQAAGGDDRPQPTPTPTPPENARHTAIQESAS